MIPAIAAPAAAPFESVSQRDPKLYARCRQFEEVLTATMLKQSLAQSRESIGGDEESGQAGFTEMAHEQLAGHIGKLGLLGLADTLYRQLAVTLPPTQQQKATP